MSSAFDTLLDAFVAQLSAATPVCSHIDTDPDAEPLPKDRTQSVLVQLGQSQSMQLAGIHGNPVDWSTEVHVKCFASANATSARPAANALANAVYTRLASAPDLGLGDGIFIGEPRIEWASEQAATRLAATTLIYTVTHRTSGGTLN